MAAMQACCRQEYEIVARRTPAEAVILVENTSSNLTSPAVYRKYSLPQVRDFVAATQRHGKKAILHMCGRLKDLLPEIRETGLDGIHGLTPPPFGDTTFQEASVPEVRRFSPGDRGGPANPRDILPPAVAIPRLVVC